MPKQSTYKPIDIPPDVNTWEMLQELAKSQPDAAVLVRAMNDTFAHFEVSESDHPSLGDIIQRYSMMLSLNNDCISISNDDLAMRTIADMVEWFNRRAESLLDND